MKTQRTNTIFVWSLTGLYAVFTTFLNSTHELWRDEVASFTIAITSPSLTELFQNIHNLGHPGLWHTLLYFGYKILPDPLILNIINLIICTLGIYVFLSKSPFSKTEKILFLLGFFPLYLYPVFNRNYGLCMLLIFICAHFYSKRKTHFFVLCLSLGLLANAHILAWIIVGVVFMTLLYEDLILNEAIQESIFKKSMGYTLLLTLILFSLFITWPDKSAVIFDGSGIHLPAIVKALSIALFYPGSIIPKVFGYDNGIFVGLILIGSYVYFSKNIRHFIIFFIGTIGLVMFFQLIYPNWGLRHSGFIYLLFLFCMWIERCDPEPEKIRFTFLDPAQRWMNRHMPSFFIVLLIMQITLGVYAIKKEIVTEFSSAKSFASFVKNRPELQDAIIMGTPTGHLYTLPYYLQNPTYHYKPHNTSLTTTLDNLLDKALEMNNKHQKPILILLPPHIENFESDTIDLAYGSKFKVDSSSLNRLQSLCFELKKFHNSTFDENYTVYQLK